MPDIFTPSYIENSDRDDDPPSLVKAICVKFFSFNSEHLCVQILVR